MKRGMAVFAWMFAACCTCLGATLEVGPGRDYDRIEAAVAKAQPGDVIVVHPQPDNAPYQRVAVYITTPGLTIQGAVAASGAAGQRVKLSGKGFDYSGRGSVPRAIFQFNRDADGCTLANFDLSGAHNESHNGAAVRINQADRITIRNCEIHHNDMGIMSSSGGSLDTAADQLIESCIIHHNGDETHPGYSHNLYLGGASVTLRYCWVHHSTTGHNVKSRAHINRIEYCYIESSANREIDLVDAEDTARPGSDALLLGNIIVKDPQCPGNRGVIHFGQDIHGQHDGAIYLVNNTIITPFVSSVLELSASLTAAQLYNNIIYNPNPDIRRASLVTARAGANLRNAVGDHNWCSPAYTHRLTATGIKLRDNDFHGDPVPQFVDPDHHDYHLAGPVRGITGAGVALHRLTLPDPVHAAGAGQKTVLQSQYRHPASGEPRVERSRPDLGAYHLMR